MRAMNALAQYIDLYRRHGAELREHAPEALNTHREAALERLADGRLPRIGDEGYTVLSVNDMFAPDYGVNVQRLHFGAEASAVFHCGIPNISTLLAVVVNDTFHSTPSLQRNLPQGVTLTSLAAAAKSHRDVVEKYYNRIAKPNAVADLNTLLAQDGVFVHVGRGVTLDRPLQIINVMNAAFPLMAVRRVLIVLEEDAHASILLCDHVADKATDYLSCQVAEVHLGANSTLEYCDIEESSDRMHRCSQFWAEQEQGSRLVANGTTLLGGHTRNSYDIRHLGEHADTLLAGMAVAADNQIVDTATCVTHDHRHCHSNQLYKYILEDRSLGQFYGTIVVDEKAEYTQAYQSNRNLLVSKDARMHTRPQLEIYCDEVKCSHGATVGQLDQNALFYMRSRGVPEDKARMLLMQAFMEDVIDTVDIPPLKARLRQLLEVRLRGTREHCADCGLNTLTTD